MAVSRDDRGKLPAIVDRVSREYSRKNQFYSNRRSWFVGGSILRELLDGVPVNMGGIPETLLLAKELIRFVGPASDVFLNTLEHARQTC